MPPTPEQSQQFDTFGCAARALLGAQQPGANRLTKDTMIDKYAPTYWATGDRCGLLNWQQVKALVTDMKLAATVKETSDLDEVRTRIRNGTVSGVIVATLKRKEPDGSYTDYRHCGLVGRMLRGDDLLWYFKIDDDGNNANGDYLTDADFAKLMPTFLLLDPK